MSDGPLVHVRLYGPPAIEWDDGKAIPLTGAKNFALLALLLNAPDGRHSRNRLQQLLWGRSGSTHGRASLRNALMAIRRSLGEAADDIVSAGKLEITVRKERFLIVGNPDEGAFLEGLEIQEEEFADWLRIQRRTQPEKSGQHARDLTKPSIVVLPFISLGATENGHIFGDLLAEEVTRCLAKSRSMTVITHLSARSIDPKSMKVNDLRSKLGADYIVYGNVRQAGGGFLLRVDLFESRTGEILWTEEVQDSVEAVLRAKSQSPAELARSLYQLIVRRSIDIVRSRPLETVELHHKVLTGVNLLYRQTLKEYSLAKQLLEDASEAAPDRPELLAWRAKWHGLNISQQWSADHELDIQSAEALTSRALDIDPTDPFVLTIRAYVNNNLLKRFDKSKSLFAEALNHGPNVALAYLMNGALLAFMDDGEAAIESCANAKRLSPLDPQQYFFDTIDATAHLSLGDYETALDLANRSFAENPRHLSTSRVRMMALQGLGRGEEARDVAQKLLRIQPNFSVENYLANHPSGNFRTGQEWARLMREAGVPMTA